MSRIKLLVITLLVLLLGACSQPVETGPGLGSPPPIACDVQWLYDAVQAANDSPSTFIVGLDGNCTYNLTGRALEFLQGNGRGIKIYGNSATINAQGNSRGIVNRGTLHLIDLTITGGYATRKRDDGNGGAISNSGKLLLTRSTVSASNSSDFGGGVFNSGTLDLLEGSSITGNTSDWLGGGVFNKGTLTLKDTSSITGNTASINGGGVYNESTFTLEDTSSITGNTASEGDGGGVYNFEYATLTLEGDSSITGNTAYRYGGGVYNDVFVTFTFTGAVEDHIYDNKPYNIHIEKW